MNLHEVSLMNSVTHGVIGLEGVNTALARPLPLRNVSVVDIIVAGRAIISSLSVLGALNILDVHDVLNRFGGGWLRPGTVNIINHHLIANELVRVCFNVIEGLQVVIGIQGIAWRFTPL